MPSASHRFIPPAAASGLYPVNGLPALALPGGRSYSCAPGSHVDVEFGQALLNTNAWIDLGEVGPTSARPPCRNDDVGHRYIDTDLGGVTIVWDGAIWRTLSGAAA